MDELETRMHAGLTQLAEPMAEAPELEQVVSRGQQLRRRRRIAGIAGGAAAVLVVASGLGMTFGSGIFANGGRGPVLATPSPVPTPSALPTMSVAPGTTGKVVFEPETLTNMGASSLAVQATSLAGGGYSVDVSFVSTNKQTDQRHAINDGRSISWFQFTPKVQVGFVPYALDWIHYVDNDGAGPFGSWGGDQRTFSELDATAVYRVGDGKGGEYHGLRGYLWRGADGVYRVADGSVLPSWTSGGSTYLVTEELGELVQVEENSALATKLNSAKPTFLTFWDGPHNDLSHTAVLLPKGASSPEPKLGAPKVEVETTTLGGRVLVVASATTRGTKVEAMTSITYTDASGKRVTSES